MAKVIRIVVHCTGEPAEGLRSREYYRHLFFDVYGWKHFGYHVVVHRNGTWEILQPLPVPLASGAVINNNTMANGAFGYNHDSLHIAYEGGLQPITCKPMDTRTPAQRETLRVLISTWKIKYNISEVVGHRDLPNVKKDCPCFDAKKEYADA